MGTRHQDVQALTHQGLSSPVGLAKPRLSRNRDHRVYACVSVGVNDVFSFRMRSIRSLKLMFVPCLSHVWDQLLLMPVWELTLRTFPPQTEKQKPAEPHRVPVLRSPGQRPAWLPLPLLVFPSTDLRCHRRWHGAWEDTGNLSFQKGGTTGGIRAAIKRVLAGPAFSPWSFLLPGFFCISSPPGSLLFIPDR